jgi:hypothetical protein
LRSAAASERPFLPGQQTLRQTNSGRQERMVDYLPAGDLIRPGEFCIYSSTCIRLALGGGKPAIVSRD